MGVLLTVLAEALHSLVGDGVVQRQPLQVVQAELVKPILPDVDVQGRLDRGELRLVFALLLTLAQLHGHRVGRACCRLRLRL